MTITNFPSFLLLLWQNLFFISRVFFFCFSFSPSAASHYAHKLREIYLLSALETHGARGRDILFIKFFILKYGSTSSTWNNFISLSFLSWRSWKFMQYFSIYGDICTIYLFIFHDNFLFVSSDAKFPPKINSARRRWIIYLFIMLVVPRWGSAHAQSFEIESANVKLLLC